MLTFVPKLRQKQNKMTQVILALGSNYEAEDNINRAKEMLMEILSEVSFTSSLRTIAIGIDAPDFLNALCYGKTNLSLDKLSAVCKDIEKSLHRTKQEKAQGIIRMDIDIMQYGRNRLHEEDWNRHYIKELLKTCKGAIKEP